MSKCPSDRPAGAFYLQPLQKPKGDIWFSKVPCGHNTLQKIVPELMKAAGVSGYFTNHSLRSSAATRLFEGSVDEQLIMSQTGHSSREGVRAFKRTTTKLSEVTSNVLNGEYHNGIKREASVSSSDLGTLSKKIVTQPVVQEAMDSSKENFSSPVLQISGGSNITINFGTMPQSK